MRVLKTQRFFQVGLFVADDDLAVSAGFNHGRGSAHRPKLGELVPIFRIFAEVALLKLDAFFLQPRCFLVAGASSGCRVENNMLVHCCPSQ